LIKDLKAIFVEAMACGCPVVSTDCPSGPWEILEGGKYGLLVPPKDPEKLAQGILQVLKNPVCTESFRRKGSKEPWISPWRKLWRSMWGLSRDVVEAGIRSGNVKRRIAIVLSGGIGWGFWFPSESSVFSGEKNGP